MNTFQTHFQNTSQLASIFGGQDMGRPLLFDYSEKNRQLWDMDVSDQQSFQQVIDQELQASNAQWGIAGYLERRESLLRNLPQMVDEERYYHLGVDVILPYDFVLHAPLAGEVVQAGYEDGVGNYGGYVLLRHAGEHENFYSFWGHLNPLHLPEVGQSIAAGQAFARLGDMHENGNWFYHTHLQVLTERGLAEGYISKGYCRADMVPVIDQYCPSPMFLLGY